ncbi:MAG: hypothetical protein ACJ75H_07360 [Thermoanaerobaculia bacterium]
MIRTTCGANWTISRSNFASLSLAALAALAVAGCSGAPAPRPLPASTLTPWQIPQAAYGSQRLYRVSYSGPEGEGSFRVTLRLVSPARYQIQAVDPVGRALWSLDVSEDSGLSLNHRNQTFCRFEGRFDLAQGSLGPFPLLSLPSLLLGRLPAQPAAGSPTAEPRGRTFDFRDESGRRWSGALGEEGSILNWTLSEGSTPKVWWMRREDGVILSDRDRGMQVRWREVLRENLDREPARLKVPASYRETPCGEPEVPDPGTPPDED